MKLKDILFELNENAPNELEIAEKLWDKLNGEYKLDYGAPLYRAEKRNVSFFVEREIRDDRVPRDMTDAMDIIVRALEDGYYTEVPKRRSSKFGATETGMLHEYGQIYYFFVPKNANVASLYRDSYEEYFYDVEQTLKTVNQEFTDAISKDYPYTTEFIDEFLDTFNGFGDGRFLYETVYDYWNQIIEERSELRNDLNYVEQWYKEINKLDVYDDIIQYFKDMKEGIHDKAGEVLVEGEKYIIVEQNFFDNHFYFKNGGVQPRRGVE